MSSDLHLALATALGSYLEVDIRVELCKSILYFNLAYVVSNLTQSDILKFHLSFNKAHNCKGV
jgi:hypothetical protein